MTSKANGNLTHLQKQSASLAVDLRSDTLTRPTAAMRLAMFQAEVGDDVWGEDPTVVNLQEVAADMLGMEAALFVPSGTMGNLIAVLAHCPRGSEVILGDQSHIYHYERGGCSALGGVVFHVVPNNHAGELPLDQLEQAFRDRRPDQHHAPPALIAIENTHNRCGGAVLSLEYLNALQELAASQRVPIHMDGARVFNAATSLGVSVKEITSKVTSISVCLSKGLGAPVGSLVLGSKKYIERVFGLRKMVGGGLRQVGVLAAPGILALTEMTKRLQIDHANAKALAIGLAQIPQVELDLEGVQSNIVVFKLKPGTALSLDDLVSSLHARGVLVSRFREGIRAVTHFEVDIAAMHKMVAAVREVLADAYLDL